MLRSNVIKLFYRLTFIISGVEAKSKEVKIGTATTISCVITGLGATATVTWTDSDGNALPGDTDFTATEGTSTDGSQTTTLLVKAAEVTADTVYTCTVTSATWPDSGSSDTTVNLDVYG